MWKSFAVVMLLACAQTALGQGFSKMRSQPAARPAAANAPDSPSYRTSRFQPVAGTRFLYATVGLGEASSKFSVSSSKPGGYPVNYVFFDTTTDTATSLLPHNDALILDVDSYSGATIPADRTETPGHLIELASTANHPPASVKEAVRWHIVCYVPADSDGDGEVTTRDRQVLAVADAGGHGFKEVLTPLGEVFAQEMLDADTLLVIHGSQARQVSVRIDLPHRKILSATPLPNFGTRSIGTR
jgi:hypothetical protein